MIALLTFLRRIAQASIVVSLLTLAACTDSNVKWSLYDVSGHLPNLRFSLQGAGDKTVTEKDFAGQTVLMFFGYASCPDICPTTMAQLTEIVNQLGDRAKDVKIVFISPHVISGTLSFIISAPLGNRYSLWLKKLSIKRIFQSRSNLISKA
jgi:protein SCO1/2